MSGTDSSSQPYQLALKAVRAALHAVQVAELLHKQLQFNEAYFLTVNVLVFAITTLLAVELGSFNDSLVIEAMRVSRVAKELLLVLSLHSDTAAQCWNALATANNNNNNNNNSHNGLPGPRTAAKDSFTMHSPSEDVKAPPHPPPPTPGKIDSTLPPSRPTLYATDSAIDVTFLVQNNHAGGNSCCSSQHFSTSAAAAAAAAPSLSAVDHRALAYDPTLSMDYSGWAYHGGGGGGGGGGTTQIPT